MLKREKLVLKGHAESPAFPQTHWSQAPRHLQSHMKGVEIMLIGVAVAGTYQQGQGDNRKQVTLVTSPAMKAT